MASSFDDVKKKADDAFRSKDYENALVHYTSCLSIQAENGTLFSNRSACFALSSKPEEALQDAEKAIQYRPQWHKGYYRKAVALNLMKKYALALNILYAAKSLIPAKEWPSTLSEFNPLIIQITQNAVESNPSFIFPNPDSLTMVIPMLKSADISSSLSSLSDLILTQEKSIWVSISNRLDHEYESEDSNKRFPFAQHLLRQNGMSLITERLQTLLPLSIPSNASSICVWAEIFTVLARCFALIAFCNVKLSNDDTDMMSSFDDNLMRLLVSIPPKIASLTSPSAASASYRALSSSPLILLPFLKSSIEVMTLGGYHPVTSRRIWTQDESLRTIISDHFFLLCSDPKSRLSVLRLTQAGITFFAIAKQRGFNDKDMYPPLQRWFGTFDSLFKRSESKQQRRDIFSAWGVMMTAMMRIDIPLPDLGNSFSPDVFPGTVLDQLARGSGSSMGPSYGPCNMLAKPIIPWALRVLHENLDEDEEDDDYVYDEYWERGCPYEDTPNTNGAANRMGAGRSAPFHILTILTPAFSQHRENHSWLAESLFPLSLRGLNAWDNDHGANSLMKALLSARTMISKEVLRRHTTDILGPGKTILSLCIQGLKRVVDIEKKKEDNIYREPFLRFYDTYSRDIVYLLNLRLMEGSNAAELSPAVHAKEYWAQSSPREELTEEDISTLLECYQHILQLHFDLSGMEGIQCAEYSSVIVAYVASSDRIGTPALLKKMNSMGYKQLLLSVMKKFNPCPRSLLLPCSAVLKMLMDAEGSASKQP